jgi:hypothetical protein
MAIQDRRAEEAASHKTLIIVVAVAAAVVIALFFYLLMRAGGSGSGEPTLQGAIRPGSPEFDKYKAGLILDDPEAFEAKRPLGDTVMTLKTTMRNLTGKTINGLEIYAAVVDHQGKPVRYRSVVVIPTRQQELAPNKTLDVPIELVGFKDTDDRANIKMAIAGVKFKE